jgi:hypothetical protein
VAQTLERISVYWSKLLNNGLNKMKHEMEENIPATVLGNRKYNTLITSNYTDLYFLSDIFSQVPPSINAVILLSLLQIDNPKMKTALENLDKETRDAILNVIFDGAGRIHYIKLNKFSTYLRATLNEIELLDFLRNPDETFIRMYKITDNIIGHLRDIIKLSLHIGVCIMDAYVAYTLTQSKDSMKIIYTGSTHTQTYCKFLEDIGYKQLYSQSANSEKYDDVDRCQPVLLDFQKVVNFDFQIYSNTN